MRLSEDKTYRTRDGSQTGIRVEKGVQGNYGVLYSGHLNDWHCDGRRSLGGEGPNDLIEETPAPDPQPFSYDACPVHEDGRRRAVTRDGREVVLFAKDLPGDHPVGGWLANDAQAVLRRWDTDGFCSRLCKMGIDLLIPPKPKRVVWVNLHSNTWVAHESKQKADQTTEDRFNNRAYPIEID